MKLSEDNLKAIGEKGIRIPTYDRQKLVRKIVHIGFGAFHRAHFLTYMDDLLSQGKTDYGVFEVDIIPAKSEMIEALREQDYLYSVLSLSSDGRKELRINGPVMGYADLVNDPDKVFEVLSSPDTELITLTITEKGYCYRASTGTLDFDNPAIKHDLESDETPKSAVGALAAALVLREKTNSPVTIMSCDNVPENGHILASCLMQFIERKYPNLKKWVSENVSFPCTMVDRITPATKAEDIESLKADYDLEDGCAVHSEDFRQWVIEDSFKTPLPDFAAAGALVVPSVLSYELMKIRLLNGSHSALSYPAIMIGMKLVHEAIQNPLISNFIRKNYMIQISGTLPPVPGINVKEYMDKLISRFSNPYIADTLLRLASDGSGKIANAIIRPLEELIAKGRDFSYVAMALAFWRFYFTFKDDGGNAMIPDDPKWNELMNASFDISLFLRTAGLSEPLCTYPPLVDMMEMYRSRLEKDGVAALLESINL